MTDYRQHVPGKLAAAKKVLADERSTRIARLLAERVMKQGKFILEVDDPKEQERVWGFMTHDYSCMTDRDPGRIKGNTFVGPKATAPATAAHVDNGDTRKEQVLELARFFLGQEKARFPSGRINAKDLATWCAEAKKPLSCPVKFDSAYKTILRAIKDGKLQ